MNTLFQIIYSSLFKEFRQRYRIDGYGSNGNSAINYNGTTNGSPKDRYSSKEEDLINFDAELNDNTQQNGDNKVRSFSFNLDAEAFVPSNESRNGSLTRQTVTNTEIGVDQGDTRLITKNDDDNKPDDKNEESEERPRRRRARASEDESTKDERTTNNRATDEHRREELKRDESTKDERTTDNRATDEHRREELKRDESTRNELKSVERAREPERPAFGDVTNRTRSTESETVRPAPGNENENGGSMVKSLVNEYTRRAKLSEQETAKEVRSTNEDANATPGTPTVKVFKQGINTIGRNFDVRNLK